ncbi:hypothetical protein [Salirhabdus salicampi]|uniref:hypothetical protein n=1 Tax=Salirhabdus salicampi TaxID=476102 RepID=UPI0020C3E858|nr:hypothetical protein [Salirhabdus salicampi]MCP8615487.1 hypothetical protein [Salirhabdus salicampi]
MADPTNEKSFKDSRTKRDVDVDRMINEGLGGGTTRPVHQQAQIEEARKLPHNDEPFPDAEKTR